MVTSVPRFLALALLTMSAGTALASVTLRPAQHGPDGTLGRLPITADCRVHVLTEDGIETLHPCGESLSLAARARTLWIEQGDAISGQVEVPLAATDMALPLVPAGEVSLVDEKGVKRARVIHAGGTRFALDLASGNPA